VDLRVDPTLPTPPSRQLVEAVLDRVAAGALRPGERLPSVRALAAQALVNPNTVNKAYRELEALGAVEGRNGAGVFVRAEGPALARAERRGATLARVQAAIETAVGAGHDPRALAAQVNEWLERAARTRNVRAAAPALEGA
jgi:DNA-binding transcriptional regulator YhcF (GntR family)